MRSPGLFCRRENNLDSSCLRDPFARRALGLNARCSRARNHGVDGLLGLEERRHDGHHEAHHEARHEARHEELDALRDELAWTKAALRALLRDRGIEKEAEAEASRAVKDAAEARVMDSF